MSKLRIQFKQYAADSGNAVVPLHVIDSKFRHVKQAPERLTLSESVEFEVEQGTYLVRVVLPSGELVTNQVSVDADDVFDVSMAAVQQSPREDLAWSYYLKSPSRQVSMRSFFPQPRIPRPNWHAWQAKGLDQWTRLPSEKIDEDAADTGDPRSFRRLSIATAESTIWLRVSWNADRAKFVALPPAESVRVNVLADDASDDDPDPVNVVVDSRNPRAESLLAYLSRGDFSAARVVAESVTNDAEQLLFEKRRDCASAAIGGYFLLLAGRYRQMHNWPRNLDEWFGFFPDGAVIHAWQALTLDTPDFDLARNRLIVAAERGLPTYTFGLRLLYDGLSLIAQRAEEHSGKKDQDVTYWARRIQPFAMCVDWQAPTTTFYGTDP